MDFASSRIQQGGGERGEGVVPEGGTGVNFGKVWGKRRGRAIAADLIPLGKGTESDRDRMGGRRGQWEEGDLPGRWG